MTAPSLPRRVTRAALLLVANLFAAACFALCALVLVGSQRGGALCDEVGDNAFSCAPVGYGATWLLALSVPALAVVAFRRYASSSIVLGWPLAVAANALLQAVIVFVLTPHP